MEKNFQVKPVMVHLYCDSCKEIEMIEDHVIKNYYYTKYCYRCPQCGATLLSEKQYPYLNYIETTIPVLHKSTQPLMV